MNELNKIIMKFNLIAFLLSCIVTLTHQDIYLHNPRGSNNRLNERSAARSNANRLFDSQNNNRGGYNVGDLSSQEAKSSEEEQYQMRYFQGSLLTLEWTQQHGCGEKVNCQIVIQSLCQNIQKQENSGSLDRLRDGLSTQTQDYTQMENINDANERKSQDVKLDRGLHETWDWYDKCNYRERNKGLFTADQILRNNNKAFSSAIYTRQNPNGNRRGYECPEERDYYPYWHPTPWTDIAILTNNPNLCDTHLNKISFNTKLKHECIEFYANNTRIHWSRWNNQVDCLNNNGKWVEFHSFVEKLALNQRDCELKGFKWAVPFDSKDINTKECLVQAKEPICKQAQFTRSNHLGNTHDGTPTNFTWEIPQYPSNTPKKCVLRVRYNISTDDFDAYTTDHKFNGQRSPVQEDPLIDIGSKQRPLRLALDTTQYGRVFQDRSHVFYVLPRPSTIRDSSTIFNLNVRGKRGNIVQVYPAVEYDFIPNFVSLSTQDWLHIQWTGSNSHLNGQPGGDGQTGDAGNGKSGTDRSNLVQIDNSNKNYPLPFELTSLWNNVEAKFLSSKIDFHNLNTYFDDFKFTAQDLALALASSGYYKCIEGCGSESYRNKTLVDSDLNTAPASFQGVLLKFNKPNSIYYYMSSRNNNFSNRSQKGKIQILN